MSKPAKISASRFRRTNKQAASAGLKFEALQLKACPPEDRPLGDGPQGDGP